MCLQKAVRSSPGRASLLKERISFIPEVQVQSAQGRILVHARQPSRVSGHLDVLEESNWLFLYLVRIVEVVGDMRTRQDLLW